MELGAATVPTPAARRLVNLTVPVPQCPLCETFWRLYARAADNLQELVGKHRNAQDGDDRNSIEMLAHEITIAGSALRSVRLELRRHERARHVAQQPEKKTSGGVTAR